MTGRRGSGRPGAIEEPGAYAILKAAELNKRISADSESHGHTRHLTIATSHCEISVRESLGAGLTVIFIHGYSSSKDVFFGQFASPLADEFHLVAVDLPGHGASGDATRPDETYSLKGYADCVIEVMENLGIDRAVVLGRSLGGHIAIEMMASCFDVVGVMVTGTPLMGRRDDALPSALRARPEQGLVGRSALHADDLDRLRGVLSSNACEDTPSSTRLRTDGRVRHWVMATCLSGDFVDQMRLMETSPVPFAIVNGENDSRIGANELATSICSNLWGGRCEVLSGAGPMGFSEASHLFNPLLRRFLHHVQGRGRRSYLPLTLSA